MSYLVAIAVSIVLFGGFLFLTSLETERGFRVLGRARDRLDTKAGRYFFIIRHVDLGAFVAHSLRAGFAYLAHEAANGSLLVVRALERFLARRVRSLRAGQEVGETGIAPTMARSPRTRLLGAARSVREAVVRRPRPAIRPLPEREQEGQY